MRSTSTLSSGNGICDGLDDECQSINYDTAIHIELVLSMRCDTDSIQNDVRCDIDECLNEILNITVLMETSNLVIPCTTLNDNGVECIAMVSVLENSTVSQNLTQQLYNIINDNKTLLNVSDWPKAH